jgi:hypothetical protein
MTLLEFLDRMGERRAARPQRPARDIRQFIGFMFLMGYYVLVWKFTTGDVPKANIDLIRDAMLTLGPPVGLIVGAMFRSDAREEQATQNTGKAFDALQAAVGTTSTAEPQPVKVMNDSANAIPVEQKP